MVRQTIKVSGINGIALTKLDVLDELEEIKMCIAYELDGKKFDEKADEQLKAMVIDYLEKLSHGLVASSMLTDDGIIDPRDTRDVIGFCLSIVSNNVIEGAKEYGVFRL